MWVIEKGAHISKLVSNDHHSRQILNLWYNAPAHLPVIKPLGVLLQTDAGAMEQFYHFIFLDVLRYHRNISDKTVTDENCKGITNYENLKGKMVAFIPRLRCIFSKVHALTPSFQTFTKIFFNVTIPLPKST